MVNIALKNYKTCPLLDEYLNYLIVIRGRSQNTVIEYRTDLLMFFSFLKEQKSLRPDTSKYDLSFIDADFVRTVTLNDMYAFISYCQTVKNAAAGTRARKIVSIRQFWKYLKNKAKVIDNNVSEVIPPIAGEMSLQRQRGADLRRGVLKRLKYRSEFRSICHLKNRLGCLLNVKTIRVTVA